MDPDKSKWAPIPQTAEEVAELRTALTYYADWKALASDPFLFAFVTVPSCPPEDVVRKIVMEIVKLHPDLKVDDLIQWVHQGETGAREPEPAMRSVGSDEIRPSSLTKMETASPISFMTKEET
jgi:hypothetical protein